MTTLWDTTGTAVVQALAAERRMGGAVTSGNALTLVVMVDERYVADAEKAAAKAAAMNPCRVLIVVRRELDAPESRLDAEILVGGRLGPGEAVVMRMYGRLAAHAESVTLPLLAPDAPVVAWWHGPVPARIATDAVGVYADRCITDCAWPASDGDALSQRAEDYAPGDTDLSWTRTTGWRAALASAFDSVNEPPRKVRLVGTPTAPSARLLAGWLSSRLDADCPIKAGKRPTAVGIDGVDFTFAGKQKLKVRRDGADLVIARTGHIPQRVSLRQRDLGDLLTEELRRQGADTPYASALASATGIPDLNDRKDRRSHHRQSELRSAERAAPRKGPVL